LSSTIVNVVVLPASAVVNPLVGDTVIPAVSSSVLVADTSAGFMPLYFASGLLAAPLMMLYAMLPSSTASFTPVTVTVFATFQFAGVKITLAGETVPSLASLELSAMVTGAVGWLLRTIVNVAVPPAS